MNLSAIEIGWHFSIYALGLIVSVRVVKCFAVNPGLTSTLKSSAFAMVAAILLFAVSTTFVVVTLGLALLLGLTGGTVQILVLSKLSMHHQSHRPVALVEANVLAAIGVCLGPLTIGFSAGHGIGWQGALALPFVALLLINAIFSAEKNFHTQVSNEISASHSPDRGLPLAVLVVLSMILFGIATEWGIGFWGALFLESALSVSTEEAVTSMSIFFGGTIFGRVVASRLLLMFSLRAILVAIITMGGFSVVVLAEAVNHKITIGALFISGACLGNFFPLILALANEKVPTRATDVTRGATLAVGVALLVIPYAIGSIGDWIGLRAAVRLLAVFPVVMLMLFFASNLLGVKRCDES